MWLRRLSLVSWRVFYELSAPFAHMVNFVDKFTIGTALENLFLHHTGRSLRD